MESKSILLPSLNRDILGNITGRLDGTTLAAASCASKDLRDTARDGELWRRICHSLWPSTATPESAALLITDYNAFYKHSYPTVFYDGGSRIKPDRESPLSGPEDFASMVDVYFKNKCIFSTVSVRVPEALTGDSEKWFSSCPFKWDVSRVPNSDITEDDQNTNANSKCGFLIQEDLRLSWVLMDRRKGKTVNLSGWDPVSIERTWSFNGDYRVQFGCIVEDDGLSRCMINTRCRVVDGGERLEVKEISLHIEELTGAHVNGRRGLEVLNQAVGCSRTMSRFKVEKGFSYYERHREEVMKSKEMKEMAAIGFFVMLEVSIFVLILYVFVQRFHL